MQSSRLMHCTKNQFNEHRNTAISAYKLNMKNVCIGTSVFSSRSESDLHFKKTYKP